MYTESRLLAVLRPFLPGCVRCRTGGQIERHPNNDSIPFFFLLVLSNNPSRRSVQTDSLSVSGGFNNPHDEDASVTSAVLGETVGPHAPALPHTGRKAPARGAQFCNVVKVAGVSEQVRKRQM
jgi:hypothetical protein